MTALLATIEAPDGCVLRIFKSPAGSFSVRTGRKDGETIPILDEHHLGAFLAGWIDPTEDDLRAAYR